MLLHLSKCSLSFTLYLIPISNRAKAIHGKPPQWNTNMFWGEKICATIQFSLFPAENIYKQYSFWCCYRYLGSKEPILLVLLFSLMPLILITCIPAWAVVILRFQNVFCFKTWFQAVILWLISSWVVIFYFWFVSKEESCQSALKQLNYFCVKTMYRQILSKNIKIILVFKRCYLGDQCTITVWI